MRKLDRGALRQVARTARTLISDAARGYRLRGRGSDNASEAGIPVDPDARRAHLARMGTSIGARMGATKLRTIGASKEKRNRLIHDSAMRSAQEVLDVMGNMKGAVMKVAQMASFAFDGLPQAVQGQLANLQSAAPPMAYELVAEVVYSELGGPPEEIFEEFEEEPMAAASIGQVHRAVTKKGEEVAVKVQYPGVDEAILADMANADLLFTTAAAMFGGFNPRALLEEVVARMTEEFDYTKEAANQQWFADRYRGHPYVKIPEIYLDLSSERVITSELVEGRRFYEVLGEPEEVRNYYGEVIFRFAFSSILVDGIFSGDPHPGNYIFMEGGRVCFLDFGLVKKFEPGERESVRGVPQAVLSRDPVSLVAALGDLGVMRDGTSPDSDRLWEFFTIMFGSIAEDEPRRYTRSAVGDAMRQVAMPDSDYSDIQKALDFPASLAIFQRYMFGTSAVLGHFEAEANWHRITREMILGEEPSTEVGRRWRHLN